MKIKIFYSWQSANTKYNKHFIYECIDEAVKKINQIPVFSSLEIKVTDALRDQVGQVAVADTIIENVIPSCDVFIADLTGPKTNSDSTTNPAPNPNVLIEYGVALNSLGKQRIISVINICDNGSPKDNSNIIPFDFRQDRFPTEYNYSSENSANKSDIKRNLTNSLFNVLKPTILHVLDAHKSKFRPFVSWNEWNDLIKNPSADKFITNDRIKALQDSILTRSNTPFAIRLLGLSGLGKTRILFETFRTKRDEPDSLITTNRILYLNCNDYPEKINFAEIIPRIESEKKDAILIVDNCNITIHKLIIRHLRGLSLISVDSNPEENDTSESANNIVIRKNELSDIVNEIVDCNFQNIGEHNIKKIKDFSQGIPLMAVLLGESVKKGETFIGRLDDKDLLDKLLGEKGNDHKIRTILKSCSIFNYFGFYDDVDTQAEFIATNTNITSLNGDHNVKVNDFYDTCDYYLQREIFEKRGRFIGMRPFPLAISLTQEWLNGLTTKRLKSVIDNIAQLQEPDRTNLSEAFAEQMKYLGYDKKANEIINNIVGIGGPFDNAEVLNKKLGARLFRSFVEVNPIAVSENLKRQFFYMPKNELQKFEVGRRDIIWTLEKLCFDKRTFSESVKILLQFAIAENETWANNATNQFLHLFNIHLAGTEASLNERWIIIEWAYNKGNDEHYNFALKAMGVGLRIGPVSRIGGAENQGSRVLEDYNPNMAEIHQYWENILDKLLEIIKMQNDYSSYASEIVANSIRSLFYAGVGNLILPYLKEISEFKNYDWDYGLQGLKSALKYEKHKINELHLGEIKELIKDLTKTDFTTRYITLSNSYFLEDDKSYSSENIIVEINKLADEFISKDVSWEENFPVFYKGNQFFSFNFGKRISELLKQDRIKINQFINYSLDVISNIKEEERNLSVLSGFIVNSNDDTKEKFYKTLYHSSEFSSQLFYFLSIDKNGKEYFNLLFELVDKEDHELKNFYKMEQGNCLAELSIEELNSLSERLFSYGDIGYAIVFDLFVDLSYGNPKKMKLLTPIYKKCIYRLGYNRSFYRQLDNYKWADTISHIASNENENEFAVFINKSIIDSITLENSYHLDDRVQGVYEILLSVHFLSIWSDLSTVLLNGENNIMTFYSLKNILGSSIGGVGRNVGVLFEGNIDIIFDWCRDNEPLAPAILAELSPIFASNNDSYTKWHPIASRIIDEFGYLSEVLSNLASNMNTYSWTGSIVPLLESKKGLFEQLTNHDRECVRDWSNMNIEYLQKEMKREKNRDAESYI